MTEMKAKPKREEEARTIFEQIPVAALIWLVISLIVFVAGFRVVTMQDQEKFIADFEVDIEENGERGLILNIVGGTFEYNVVPEVATPVQEGSFTDGEDSFVAGQLFENLDFITEVRIEAQSITILLEEDIEADAQLNRVSRQINNAVLTDRETIEGEVSDDVDNALVFTTTEDTFEYGQYTPTLIPEDQSETYESRDEGERGSPLAQFLFAEVGSLETLTIEPDRLIVTYAEGAPVNPFIDRVVDALNDFHPRASLLPNLSILTLGFDDSTILSITPRNTGLPLVLFTLLFAVIEGGLFFALRDSNDKLVRPLLRVVMVFLFSWSIFGHEPLWDFLLHWLFPTSRQLLHPNGTVIDFTAEHLELVLVSSFITIPAGLLFGVAVTRDEFRELLPLVNNLVNSGQTVPTIAIVAIMAPIIGLGFWPAIVALVAYGLLPVVRNSIAGVEAVSDFVIDSGRGMGMTPRQILFRIEMPIASRIIMAGIRTSVIINVGTATLGAFVGSGGLGTPISSGIAMTVDAFILLGAIPAALLAILLDYIMERIEYVLTPRGLQIET